MRRGAVFQLVVFGLSRARSRRPSRLVPWLPDAGVAQAGRIVFVYWFATVISILVFAVVAAILVYSIIHFRAKPGDIATARRSTATRGSRSSGRSSRRCS